MGLGRKKKDGFGLREGKGRQEEGAEESFEAKFCINWG